MTINILFEEQVNKSNNDMAIICKDKSITYKKLNERVNILARNLREQGVKKDIIVAIVLNRSIEMIISILAVLKAGGAYLPIDPTYPIDRINYMIDDSSTLIVLTNNEYRESLVGRNVFNLDEMDFSKGAITNLINVNNDNDLAYVVYTSGSTGKSKGVMIEHKSVVNFIESISYIMNFLPSKSILCLTTMSFDIFVLETILPLIIGMKVILADENEQKNPKLMCKLINNNKIDMIQMTPSRMQLLVNYDKELFCFKYVKEIMVGGESLPINLLRTLQQKTSAKIYNMYGPTETTIWSTISDLTKKENIDIGCPIRNTEVYIVDESLYILPNGKVGEICIAGKGIARDYVGRDHLASEKFIYLPQKSDIRVYRTGDLGRYLPDGNLEYLGRTDNQIKIRGHRIELEEIEVYLNQFDGIKQSVVIASEIGETNKVLEVFYTSEVNINPKEIADYLSSKLPSYMIPAIFKRVEDFIQTENGKIDRKRVSKCKEIKVDPIMFQEVASDEMTNVKKKMLELIASNLDAKISNRISWDTTFTSLKIDSIIFIKIIVALENEFDFEFDDEMLLFTAFSTVGAMIEYIESKVTS